MTSQEKKEYLQRYRAAEAECIDIDRRLKELRARYTSRAIQYDDMPKAHDSEHDLSEYAAELDQLEAEAKEVYAGAVRTQREIYQALRSMKDGTHRRVLELRYVDGYTFEKIAVLMELSYQWVCELHGRALQEFCPPLDRT